MNPRAFFHDGSNMTNLGAGSGGFESRAHSVNASGQVAGTAYGPAGAQATLWSGGATQSLGSLGGSDSYAMAINAAGQVAGSATNSGGVGRAFLYSAGTMVDLGGAAQGWSAAYGINDGGHVVGYGETEPGVFRAFWWNPVAGMTFLDTLGGAQSYAFAINASGSITGHSNSPEGYLRAYLYANGAMADLGTLGGFSSFGYGINDYSYVVGHSFLANSPETHAFLYAGGAMHDLNRLIPRDSGWLLTQAYGINNAGQIAGMGLLDGRPQAFRLDPLNPDIELWGASDSGLTHTPEPGTLGLLALGFAAILLGKRRKIDRR